MPLYEYLCHSCGKKFEVLQKFSDDPVATHAECGGVAEKLISAPSFHFKGTGWYVTDYAKGNGGPAKPGEGKSDSDSAKKADGGGEKSEKKESGEKKESKDGKESKPAAPAASSSPTTSESK
jgi:putative FmdB family regulatory protein